MTSSEYDIMAMIIGLADKLGISPEELAEAQQKMRNSKEGSEFSSRASKRFQELEDKKN